MATRECLEQIHLFHQSFEGVMLFCGTFRHILACCRQCEDTAVRQDIQTQPGGPLSTRGCVRHMRACLLRHVANIQDRDITHK
jgi:hypothetical protein